MVRLCAGIILLLAVPLHAFDTPGHDVIEAAAYRWLLEQPRGAFPELPNESGKSILDTLISCGLLHRPDGYDDLVADVGLRDRLPRIGSGDPDLIFTRQFSANGQQFHFMAVHEDIYESPDVDAEPPPAFPRDLQQKAYPRCIRFLSGLTAEMLYGDREAIANAERGVYAVLHSIGDSYSNGHAARTDDLRGIIHLKGWDVTGVVVNIIHPSGWKWMGAPAQHGFSERNDADYLRSDTLIADRMGNLVSPFELQGDPYAIPEACLTRRGLAGREAIAMYLVSLVRMLRADTREAATEIWREYLGGYFGSPAMPEVVRAAELVPQPEEEQEPNNAFTFGATGFYGRGQPLGGQLSASLQLPMMMAAPMQVTAQIHAGYIYENDIHPESDGHADQVFIDVEPFTNYQLPVLDNLAIDWSVFVIRANLNGDAGRTGDFELYTRLPRVQVFLTKQPSIALTLSGPTVNVISGRNAGYFGLGVDVGNLGTWRVSEGRVGTFDEPAGDRWRVSDRMDTLDGGRTSTMRLITGSFERGAKIYPDRVWMGLELMSDRDEHTRRSGPAMGWAFGVGWTPFDEFDNAGLGLSVAPVFRYRHHSTAFSIGTIPFQATVQWGGASIADAREGRGGRGTPNLWWYGSIHATATWGRTEIAVDLLRWGYGDLLGAWSPREIELIRWGFAGFQLSVLL